MGKLVVLGGPTAAGKSALAIRCAEAFDIHLVSADAMTVYRKLNIGTAKPSKSELEIHTHHCVDVCDIDEEYSVADFVSTVESLLKGNKPVLVAGGTPFYLAALTTPLADLPSANAQIRSELAKLTDAHDELRRIDPTSADRIHPNDLVRVHRAIEVFRISGKTLTQLQLEGAEKRPLAKDVVWLDPEPTRIKIDTRLNRMVEEGYVEEVETLLSKGWDPQLKPFCSFAYKHMVSHIEGVTSLEEAIRKTSRDTWRLARKQRTWARGQDWKPLNVEQSWGLLKSSLT